jgi:hypothetical protein
MNQSARKRLLNIFSLNSIHLEIDAAFQSDTVFHPQATRLQIALKIGRLSQLNWARGRQISL